jgi:hypothetical protein
MKHDMIRIVASSIPELLTANQNTTKTPVPWAGLGWTPLDSRSGRNAIDQERSYIEQDAPKGLEINVPAAIRVLLHEALGARRAKREAR